MNKKALLLTLAGIFTLGLLTGCQQARPMVEDPTISLQYLKEPTEANLTSLSKAYAQSINRARKDAVKRPGLCSEYAITLALLGDQAQASQWFNREVAEFPSSRDYVLQLKRIYCPAYAADQTTASGEIAEPAEEADAQPAGTNADAAVQQVIDQAQPTTQAQPKDKPAKSKGKKKPSKKPRKH